MRTRYRSDSWVEWDSTELMARHKFDICAHISDGGILRVTDCLLVATQVVIGGKWCDVTHDEIDVRKSPGLWDEWREEIEEIARNRIGGLFGK